MPTAIDLTARAHEWLAPMLAPGGGGVHAFDVQRLAIERARQRLERASAGAPTLHVLEQPIRRCSSRERGCIATAAT